MAASSPRRPWGPAPYPSAARSPSAPDMPHVQARGWLSLGLQAGRGALRLSSPLRPAVLPFPCAPSPGPHASGAIWLDWDDGAPKCLHCHWKEAVPEQTRPRSPPLAGPDGRVWATSPGCPASAREAWLPVAVPLDRCPRLAKPLVTRSCPASSFLIAGHAMLPQLRFFCHSSSILGES